MSDTTSRTEPKPEEVARRQVERAEAGDAEAAARLDTLEETAPEAAEAAEQEAADGPPGRGVSR